MCFWWVRHPFWRWDWYNVSLIKLIGKKLINVHWKPWAYIYLIDWLGCTHLLLISSFFLLPSCNAFCNSYYLNLFVFYFILNVNKRLWGGINCPMRNWVGGRGGSIPLANLSQVILYLRMDDSLYLLYLYANVMSPVVCWFILYILWVPYILLYLAIFVPLYVVLLL